MDSSDAVSAVSAPTSTLNAKLIQKENVANLSVSADWVYDFLKTTRDYNSFHQAPHNYMPGMGYLALVAKYIDKPIKHLDLRFRGFVNFPMDLPLEKRCFDNLTVFDVGEGKRPYCQATFKFGKNSEKIDNRGLEDFAKILGVEAGNLNLRKIWLACLIPGELLRHFNDDGMYSSQELDFLGDLAGAELRLNISKNLPGRTKILTEYVSGTEVVATGKAVVFKRTI